MKIKRKPSGPRGSASLLRLGGVSSFLWRRDDSDSRVAVADQADDFLCDGFESVIRFTEIEPLSEDWVRRERGEALDQRRVMLLSGADEHSSPRFRVRTEAQDHSAIQIDGFGAEHRAQDEGGIALQWFP